MTVPLCPCPTLSPSPIALGGYWGPCPCSPWLWRSLECLSPFPLAVGVWRSQVSPNLQVYGVTRPHQLWLGVPHTPTPCPWLPIPPAIAVGFPVPPSPCQWVPVPIPPAVAVGGVDIGPTGDEEVNDAVVGAADGVVQRRDVLVIGLAGVVQLGTCAPDPTLPPSANPAATPERQAHCSPCPPDPHLLVPTVPQPSSPTPRP